MPVEILKRIKITRLLQGVTQEDMAKQLNISIPTYSRFERGITKTTYHLTLKVCQILTINLNNECVLFSEKDEVTDNAKNDINTQLAKLIRIAEEQQKMNALLLKKLKYITENCTCI